MKRRSFLFGSLAAVAATALPIPIAALAPAPELPPLPFGFITPMDGKMMIWSDTGWIECVGQALSRAEYPALLRAVGTFWGWSDGKGDGSTFSVADLSGWAGKPRLFGETPGRTTADIWNDALAAQDDTEEFDWAPVQRVEPHRDHVVDDGLGPDGPSAGKFHPKPPDIFSIQNIYDAEDFLDFGV